MKHTPTGTSLTVKRLDQLHALAHPLRYRIFERLVVEPGSPKAVALDMGLKGTRLYHHFGVLEEAGLIKRTRSRRTRGTVERIYSATAERIVMDKARLGAALQPGGSVALQALHATVRDVERCEELAHAENREPELNIARLVLHLSPARVAELEARLAEFLTDAQREDSGSETAEYHFTVAAYRAAPRPSAGNPNATA